jgi:hypothetical protein
LQWMAWKGEVTLAKWRELPLAKFSPPARSPRHRRNLALERRSIWAYLGSLAAGVVLHGRGLARRLVRDTKRPDLACGGAWLVWCGTPNRPLEAAGDGHASRDGFRCLEIRIIHIRIH